MSKTAVLFGDEKFMMFKVKDIKTRKKYADAVPRPNKNDLKVIKESIAKDGIKSPLFINTDGVLLDGHTRFGIAKDLGVKTVPVIVKQFSDELEEYLFVIEINITRRNLTEGQQAHLIVACLDIEEKLARKRQGTSSGDGRAAEKVADKFGISPRQVDKIRKIEREGSSEIKEKFKSGKLTTNAAYQAVQKETRVTNTKPLPKGKYNIVYIDFPWEYDNKATGGSHTSGASQKYDTMTPDEIIDRYFGREQLTVQTCNKCGDAWSCIGKFASAVFCSRCGSNDFSDEVLVKKTVPKEGEDIKSIIAKDCVLFMWMTVPMFEDQWKVVEEFKKLGFRYKTEIFWIKTGHKGMGNWYSNQVEILMMCVKGKIEAFRSSLPNYIIEPVGKHSEKPTVFRNLIERSTVSMGKRKMIELFARRPAKNWKTWGNEI